MMRRTLVIGAVVAFPLQVACGGGPERAATTRPELSPNEHASAVTSARTFAHLYFGPLARAEATLRDLRRLRAVTTPEVYAELEGRHRLAAKQRRESEYARDKLDDQPRCDVGEVRITVRGGSRVLAEPLIRCAGRPVGWGYELVHHNGAWVVGDLGDARFDSAGRCVATTCK